MHSSPPSLRPKEAPPPAARRPIRLRGLFGPGRTLAAMSLLIAASLPAAAHERHPVDATLRLEPDRYTIVLPFDVPALMLSRTLNHTDAEAAARELLGLSPEQRERAFTQAERYLRINLSIEIDGKRSAPDVELPTFDPGPLGQLGQPGETFYVRLRGPIPPGSKALTLTPGRALREWTVTPFAIGGRRLAPLALTGGISGPPISLLPPPPPPPLTGVIPQAALAGLRSAHGLAPVLPLFLLALALLDGSPRTLADQLAAWFPGLLLGLGLTVFGYLKLPMALVEAVLPLTVILAAGDALLANRLQPWRPPGLFLAGVFSGAASAETLGIDPDLLPRPAAAFAGWSLGQLAAVLAFALPVLVLLRLARRRGLFPRFRGPLLAVLALLGAGGLAFRLAPF